MKTSGGYQILDLTGVTINAEAAVTFADAKNTYSGFSVLKNSSTSA